MSSGWLTWKRKKKEKILDRQQSGRFSKAVLLLLRTYLLFSLCAAYSSSSRSGTRPARALHYKILSFSCFVLIWIIIVYVHYRGVSLCQLQVFSEKQQQEEMIIQGQRMKMTNGPYVSAHAFSHLTTWALFLLLLVFLWLCFFFLVCNYWSDPKWKYV